MVQNSYRYSLNSKVGKGTCPKCEKKGKFVFYVDNSTGEILHELVGRCDREYSCGYHYTPKQFFDDNASTSPMKRSFRNLESSSTKLERRDRNLKQSSINPLNPQKSYNPSNQEVIKITSSTTLGKPRNIYDYQQNKFYKNTYIPNNQLLTGVTSSNTLGKSYNSKIMNNFTILHNEDLLAFNQDPKNSILFNALQDKIAELKDYNSINKSIIFNDRKITLLENVFCAYRVLTNAKGESIFLQIDHKDRIRTGKIMSYDRDGHRNGYVNWLHTQKDIKEKYPNFALKQCLFGQHFLSTYDEKMDRINIVESEKTALIMSVFKPEYLWLATGGCANLNEGMLSFLLEINISKLYLYPDKGEWERWQEKAQKIMSFLHSKHIYTNIYVDKTLEDIPCKPNTDLADVLLSSL